MNRRLTMLILIGLGAIYGTYMLVYYFEDDEKVAITVPEAPRTIVSNLPVPVVTSKIEKVSASVSPLVSPTIQAKIQKPAYTNREFDELTSRTWKKMPRISVVRKKHQDFHFPPPELTEMADGLGSIGDAMDLDPKLIKAGTQFLRRCALDTDVMEAARAVCLRDLMHWSIDPVDLKEFPDNIRKLSESLPQNP